MDYAASIQKQQEQMAISDLLVQPDFSRTEPISLTRPTASFMHGENITATKPRFFVRACERVRYEGFVARLHLRNLCARVTRFSWRFSRPQISGTARIHPSAYVSSHKVKIGSGCVIGPKAVVHANSILDDEVSLSAGCVIGSDSFRYQAGIHVIHAGGVHLHSRVRVLSRACADKATNVGSYTEISEGSCVDEQVHIGHNVTVGRRCHVGPHAMISGEVTIGDDVMICRNASISNSLTIGNSVRIGPGAVVTTMVQDGKSLSGNFAIDSGTHRQFVRRAAEGNIMWLT